MLLHSGVAMHSHEYSGNVPKRSPLSRNAFSTPLPRRASASDTTSLTLHRPSTPVRLASEYTPRLSEPVVRFQEPEADTMSEDGRSVANSEGSETTTRGSRRRRRSTRTSTAFHLAHPAPTLTQKQRLLQIRPKLLLQLQRLSAESRPKPAIDVLPSTVVVPRLVKKFPRMFRGKAELGANDVMVVKSEEYDTLDEHVVEDTDSDEECLGNRVLMAVICQMRKDHGGSQGKAEIVLSDGSVWVATPLPNSLYEFVTVDEWGNKITTRWVKRSTRRSNSEPSVGSEFKFTFSIIDPNTRRHPILASMTNYTLDIPDSYTSVSSSAGKYPPTSPVRRLSSEGQCQAAVNESNAERSTHFINENMRTLIQVTGIWVALRQGLSPYFRYNDAMTSITTSSPVLRNASAGGRLRSRSVTTDAGRASPTGTIAGTPESVQGTFGGRIRQKCARGSPSIAASPQFDPPGPKRSASSGSAFMLRAAARKAGNPPSTVISDSEGEVLSARKRAATEDLTGSLPSHSSTPQRLSLPASSATTVETPTKPQRRTQSAYIPQTVHQSVIANGIVTSHTVDAIDETEAPDPGKNPKPSRWRAFKDCFRRLHSTTRSP